VDRHDLYERCVQSPRHLAPLIRAIHGQEPRILAEDFCGTAALSRAWIEASDEARAIAVDADDDVLERARAIERLQAIRGDVIEATSPPEAFGADVLFVGNFSIGYWHSRAELIRYLRHARARLTRPASVFLCDTYGGESAFLTGHVHRDHPGPEGTRIRYTWEQREADPLTGMVVDALHFRVSRGGTILDELHDAFVYHWRLWSVPELRDAMIEAGFSSTSVYAKVADAEDDEGNVYVEPVSDPDELDDSFIVLVAARA